MVIDPIVVREVEERKRTYQLREASEHTNGHLTLFSILFSFLSSLLSFASPFLLSFFSYSLSLSVHLHTYLITVDEPSQRRSWKRRSRDTGQVDEVARVQAGVECGAINSNSCFLQRQN